MSRKRILWHFKVGKEAKLILSNLLVSHHSCSEQHICYSPAVSKSSKLDRVLVLYSGLSTFLIELMVFLLIKTL